ncbi:hypothetical protein LVJ82_15005 [Vitreoscilla massiliensis]|uniref:Uncharacterized protein n=1 Tax=Vitreoscilla massiliensis TaxID=1689272 RepID=A0ABY4DZ06_9NEIS|nr:hypothetical protein [Vitreoscilla massiliensis]UOO88751.1 hypothetical protein LVJ82_15005 [Vitreoscilla massiliensis]
MNVVNDISHILEWSYWLRLLLLLGCSSLIISKCLPKKQRWPVLIAVLVIEVLMFCVPKWCG